jgi:hypothetical protein
MTSCCACCCFYPKYKRRVDNIYPRNLDLPLIKAEVDKLQYYAKIHPEKLSKIGEYLYQNLKWGLSGTYKNRNYVKNTIEAVDKILLVITPQDLNYYAGNYLKIVKKLLEQVGASTINTSNSGGLNGNNNKDNKNNNKDNLTNNINNNNNNQNEYLEYQKMAAMLFQKFCEKEAANLSTTSYNLNYDTFVCQFSSMCYNNNKDERTRAEIRSSGLQCLATMVKRLVPDDSLRAGYLWDNMDKIVPALLFIMHENFLNTYSDINDQNFSVEDEIRSLSRYLYSDFFVNNNKFLINSNNNKKNPDDDEVIIRNDNGLQIDNVRVEFRKKIESLNSENNNNNNKSSSSESSTPDEAGVMINLNDKRNISGSLEVVDPDHEAKMLLKSLASKADYTTISKIVVPILAYLDDNKPCGWEYSRFVHCIFLILMYNVKQQHAIVIKELIKHLDSHRNSSAQLKCHIIKAISICIRISAMHSIGTTGQIIEIFTNLLKHLNFSVERVAQCKTQLISKTNTNLTSQKSNQETLTNTNLTNELNEQKMLQNEIISAMGQFTSHLPDYAKNDVIMFIARTINSQQISYIDLVKQNSNTTEQQISAKDQLNSQLRSKYFECLIEICTKYKPTQLFSAFSGSQFLEDILKLTLVTDWSSRRKAHEILHQLLDRYQVMNKIKQLKPNLFLESSLLTNNVVTIKSEMNKSVSSIVIHNNSKSDDLVKSNLSLDKITTQKSINKTYLSQLNLNENNLRSSKEDIHFMRKYGRTFLAYLNEGLFLSNNRRENFESIYLTTCLFIIGLFNENEFLIDLIKFGFHIQELALLNHEQNTFTFGTQCNIHKFLCAYFLLVSKSSGLDDLIKYCNEICEMRKRKDLFRFVYPEYILIENNHNNNKHNINSSTNNVSLSEIETEFKRDLTKSAKLYFEYVSSSKKDSKTLEEKEEEALVDESSEKSKSNYQIQAGWLFDKKAIINILESAGFPAINIKSKTNDFSLSVAYIQQSQIKIQSILKYRCPYSNSYESLSAFNPNENNQLGVANSIGSSNYNINDTFNQQRLSKSGFGQGQTSLGISPNQITPRRSLDVDSNMDDDTSYDSASQVSIDRMSNYDLDFMNQLNQLANIPVNEQNQSTVNSINLLKQQYYLQQQYHDLTSFETLKRVLFNGGGAAGFIGSNMSNSGVGSTGIEETTLISSSINNGIGIYLNMQSNGGGVVTPTNEDSDNMSSKLINDFKQKPFDEIRQSLQKKNQSLDKYQQVFDLISKEIQQSGLNNGQMASSFSSNILITKEQQLQTQQSPSISNNNNNANGGFLGSTNQNVGASSTGNMANYANTSISSLSNQSSSFGSSAGILYNSKENGAIGQQQQQQKMVPLNDIEFPQLFMY